jgi:hypothetical protein
VAKTKVELESDFNRHEDLMNRARQARREGDYRKAVEMAESAWPFIDGMMQYARRFNETSEHSTIDSIDLVLRLAPLLFDFETLNKLAELLKTYRRIDKNTTADLAAELARARSLMMDAHRLWDYLERHGDIRQDDLRRSFGGDQECWRGITELWERMGVVVRAAEGGSYRVRLATRMNDDVRAKCSCCGVAGKASKSRLLEEITCPKCQHRGLFVILRESPK